MGQASVQASSYLFPQQSLAISSTASTSATPRADSVSGSSSGDALTLNGETAVAGTYHATIAQVSFAIRLQQVRAQLDGGQGEFQASGQQLEFSFSGQVRSEELALFGQRSSATANGLDGAQRETYMEASQRIAARFQMSLTMSGAALQGFTSSADALKNSRDAWDQFMKLSNQALSQSDDMTSQVLDLLNGFFKHTDSANSESFAKFIDQLFGMMKGMFSQANQTAQTSQSGASASATQVQIDIQMSFSVEFTSTEAQVRQSDPITLDLDGNGIELTNYADGAKFDITGTGKAVNTAFVKGGDAFLAIDRNGNGRIDSGKELFGDQNGAANGYEELRKLDSNADGLIDSRDRDFNKLVLFKGNAKNGADTLQSLADAGIAAISLNYRNTRTAASGGNSLGQVGAYVRTDGTKGLAADTILNYLA